MSPLQGLFAIALLAPDFTVGHVAVDAHHPSGRPAPEVQFTGPTSIGRDHKEIHDVLARAMAEPGELGEAARALAAVLGPHFKREEEIAVPPLGLLEPLSRGPVTTEMRAILPTTQQLEKELPRMLVEHKQIGAARERLEAAARAAGRGEYVEFSQTLAAHAGLEEEVLYPAAVLVGRYIAADGR